MEAEVKEKLVSEDIKLAAALVALSTSVVGLLISWLKFRQMENNHAKLGEQLRNGTSDRIEAMNRRITSLEVTVKEDRDSTFRTIERFGFDMRQELAGFRSDVNRLASTLSGRRSEPQ